MSSSYAKVQWSFRKHKSKPKPKPGDATSAPPSRAKQLAAAAKGSSAVSKRTGQWARKHGAAEVKVPANWTFYGSRAGPVRNAWMLALQPDMVIAFPGGSGTQNMVKQALAAGIPTFFPDFGNVLLPARIGSDGSVLAPAF